MSQHFTQVGNTPLTPLKFTKKLGPNTMKSIRRKDIINQQLG
jgi:hypothetical protein